MVVGSALAAYDGLFRWDAFLLALVAALADSPFALTYMKAHDAAADDYRAVIVERWGPRAVVSLAFAITTARIYPTVKYAMGHGKACTRVVIAGSPVAIRRGLTAKHFRTDISASVL